MQINSRTFSLSDNDYSSIEKLLDKIASYNNIKNVEAVNISLDKESGILKFKTKEAVPQDLAEEMQPFAKNNDDSMRWLHDKFFFSVLHPFDEFLEAAEGSGMIPEGAFEKLKEKFTELLHIYWDEISSHIEGTASSSWQRYEDKDEDSFDPSVQKAI